MNSHPETLAELKAELNALRERERFYRELVEEQSELVCRFTPDGSLTYVNAAYARYFGRRPEDLVGVNLYGVVPEEDRLMMRKHLAGFGPGRTTASLEHRAVLPDGTLRWQHWLNKALFDDSGRITGFQAAGRDITTRRIVEEALLKVTGEKETYRLNLEAIFRSIPEGIVTVDDGLNVLAANQATRAICPVLAGIEPGEGLPGTLCPHEDGCVNVLRRAVARRRPVEETRVECAAGRPGQVVVLNASPLLDVRNAVGGAVLVIRDISRLASLERQLGERHRFANMVGKSEAMQRVYTLIEQLAGVDTTVLVTGESGTGKELVVEALHAAGSRAAGPLVKVNCSALSENLLESELFGHVRGSFTGAIQDKVGRFEAAQGGTILLDEIGDISPGIQLKLLRVLERKEYERVGDSRMLTADVRVVAATNVDLMDKVRQGAFREDLYYRLKVVVVHLPPLRARKEDIPALCEHFLDHFRRQFRKNLSGLAPEVLQLFLNHAWPGNVRELKHSMEHAAILCRASEIGLADLPPELAAQATQLAGIAGRAAAGLPGRRPKSLAAEEIEEALRRAGGNKSKAARLLGMSRRTFYRKLDELGLSPM